MRSRRSVAFYMRSRNVCEADALRRTAALAPINQTLLCSSGRMRTSASLGQQAQLAGLNLQAEILGVNAALGETAGDKPQARLSGPREHVPQLLSIAESPDRTNAVGDIIAKQLADQMFLAFVAGR